LVAVEVAVLFLSFLAFLVLLVVLVLVLVPVPCAKTTLTAPRKSEVLSRTPMIFFIFLYSPCGVDDFCAVSFIIPVTHEDCLNSELKAFHPHGFDHCFDRLLKCFVFSSPKSV
jgi:hypothetical protein